MPGANRVTVEKKAWPLKLMVWGAISPLGRSPLFIFDGNVNSEQYCEVLVAFRDWIVDEFGPRKLSCVKFQHDNARPHISGATQRQAESLGIQFVPNWPPYSPDLNPIEQMWGLMVPIVDRLAPKTIDDLAAAINEAWMEVPQERVRKLAYSPWDRAEECIAKGGGQVGDY
eukprot:PhM_4_TR17456/c2_g3_i5/m.36631